MHTHRNSPCQPPHYLPCVLDVVLLLAWLMMLTNLCILCYML